MRKKSASPRVVVVAGANVPVFELAVACEVFGTDRRDLTDDWYDFALVGTERTTRIQFGLTIPAGPGLAALGDADMIVVPACADVQAGAPPALLEALRVADHRGARIVSLCSGAFVLAEAGLLDRRRATTHWMHADELARRYPLVTVDPTVLYVHDRVWTSAGSGAALDLCLELVRHDLGAAVANEVARRIVIPPHRDGGQAQYIRPRPRPTPHGPADVEEWARTNLADVTVTGLAGYAGVSTRTLNRHFRERTGRTPQEWIKRERMLAAQELLEGTDLTVDAIAGRVGLGTAANLRAHFAQAFGTSPSSYRRTFATSLRAGVA